MGGAGPRAGRFEIGRPETAIAKRPVIYILTRRGPAADAGGQGETTSRFWVNGRGLRSQREIN